MPVDAPTLPSDLPDISAAMSALVSPDWDGDFAPVLGPLFAGEAGLMQQEGAPVAFRNRHLKELALNRAVGNMTVDLLGAPFDAVAAPDEDGFHRFMEAHIFVLNPPVHSPVRQLFARHLTKSRISEYEQVVAEAIAAVIAETAASAGPVDAHRDFCAPLVARFWAGVLGFTPEESLRAAGLTADLAASLRYDLSEDELRQVNSIGFEYTETFEAAIERRLAAGDNEMLNEMAAEFEAVDAPGRPRSLPAVLAAVFFDGFDTMSRGIANVLFAITASEDPALERIRRDPSLVPAAFLEGLRLHPPLFMTARMALEDIEYDGVQIPEGTPISMMWLFGNRDPDAYDDPEVFRLDRPAGPQMTFGGGFHICPGRSATRAVAEMTIAALADEGVELARAGEPHWQPMAMGHMTDSMPISIRAR